MTKIEIKHSSKTYEIEKDKKEQKVRPKGVIWNTGDEETEENKEITVKNYQESFWSTTVEIEGNKMELEWGNGKKLTIYGVPSVIVTILGILAFFYLRKDNLKAEINLKEIKEKFSEPKEEEN